MNSAANRAASEVRAQMVAITVMLVVAGFFFIPVKYWLTNHLQRIAICRCIWTLIVEGTQDETD